MSNIQKATTLQAIEDFRGTAVKGGEIQILPTSGTTTVTQEMSKLVMSSLEPEVPPAQSSTPQKDK